LTTGFIDNVTVEYKNRENNLVGQTQKNDSGENFSVSKMKPSEIEQKAFDGLENRLVDQGLQKEESVTIVNLSFPNKI
jgi:major membrane immunogen (membrane-anchored lipoprotein)